MAAMTLAVKDWSKHSLVAATSLSSLLELLSLFAWFPALTTGALSGASVLAIFEGFAVVNGKGNAGDSKVKGIQ